VVVDAALPGAPFTLREVNGEFELLPLGVFVTPVGVSRAELVVLDSLMVSSAQPLAPVAHPALALVGRSAHSSELGKTLAEPEWALMVRLLGQVGVESRAGVAVEFERSKALELVVWLTQHRQRATRTSARTALWDLDVRDATFANVVSDARRALARAVPPNDGEEWIDRTMTESLPLHRAVVTDVDIVQARLDAARHLDPADVVAMLRPAVHLIEGAPLAGTSYLWPDAEGITSAITLLAVAVATEFANAALTIGDCEGVFWSTGRGLLALPGHEELIAIRMRAHAALGNSAGVRQEWESYERVLLADSWSAGEPAPKLVALRKELLRQPLAS
jgi:two-component SAPR family response regulator